MQNPSLDRGLSSNRAFGLLMILLALITLIEPLVLAATPSNLVLMQPPQASTLADELPSCPTSLMFGQLVECSISVAGERDSYTFAADANDRILVRIVRVTGTFGPEFQIVNGSGTSICGTYGTTVVGSTCDIASAGTYTLQVFESFNGQNTGDYRLYIQRLNNPGNAQPVVYAERMNGSIEYGGEFVTYTFNAAANDNVLVRMVRTTGSIGQEFTIYNQRGESVCGTYGGVVVGRTCQLLNTERYTLLVFESFSNLNTGNYTLYLQRLNNPSGATSLSFGQTTAGMIDAPGAIQTYQFSANASDQVLFRLVRSTGTFGPEFQIYNANGINICGTYGTSVVGTTCAFADTATYTLLVYQSFSGLDTGTYRLYLQRLNDPGGAVNISFGERVSDSIDIGGAFDTYTFDAAPNDRVFMRIVRTTGSFGTEFQMFDSAGIGVCGKYGGSLVGEICTLTSGGRYTILIFESFSGLNTGDYTFEIQRLNNPGAAVTLTAGQQLEDSIEKGGEFDTYAFSALANAQVQLQVMRTSGTFGPEFEVYDPMGTRICGTYGSPTAQVESCVLPYNGTYTILVFESFGGQNTGAYTVLLKCLTAACAGQSITPTPVPVTPTPPVDPTATATPSPQDITLVSFYGDRYKLQRKCYELLVVVRNPSSSAVTRNITLRESAQYRRRDQSLLNELPEGRSDRFMDCDTGQALATGGIVTRAATIPAGGTATYRFHLRHDWDWIERPTLAKTVLKLVVDSVLDEIVERTGVVNAETVKLVLSASDFQDSVMDSMNALPEARYTYTVETSGLTAQPLTVLTDVPTLQIGYLRASIVSSGEIILSCPLTGIIVVIAGPVCAVTTAASISLYYAAYDPAINPRLFQTTVSSATNQLPSYAQLVEPVPIVLPMVEAISDPQERSYAQSYLDALSYQRAALLSLARKEEASSAGDQVWEVQHRTRLTQFTRQEQAAREAAATAGATFLSTLPRLSTEEAQQQRATIVASGFGPQATELLLDVGLSDDILMVLRDVVGRVQPEGWPTAADILIGNAAYQARLDVIEQAAGWSVYVPLLLH